ncbi:MAG: DUF481 domain-containing protein [Bacteroidales bacterium]|nr:DUF481 domain-containing protein [Bacteroidales bacterium]
MRKVLAIILLVACVGSVSAQKKWSWNFGANGTLNSGNVENMNFSHNGGVDRNDSLLAFSANYKFVYGEQDKVTNNLGLSGGVQFDVWQYDRWSPFVSDMLERNTYKGIDFKNAFLFGVKYRIITKPGVYDYSISGALVGDYTDYHFGLATVSDEGFAGVDGLNNNLNDTLSGWKARVSLRFKVKQKITDAVSLKHTTFYQPNLVDFSDYLVNSVTSIDTKLNKNLSLNLSFAYDYKSVVPAGKENYDIVTSVGLKLAF